MAGLTPRDISQIRLLNLDNSTTNDILVFDGNGWSRSTLPTGFAVVGSTVTEGTNTTPMADLITVSGLSIAVGKPWMIVCNVRCDAGSVGCFGVKINTTDIVMNSQASNVGVLLQASGKGVLIIHGCIDTNYERGVQASISSTIVNSAVNYPTVDAPVATITSLTIRGSSSYGNVWAKNMYVYA